MWTAPEEQHLINLCPPYSRTQEYLHTHKHALSHVGRIIPIRCFFSPMPFAEDQIWFCGKCYPPQSPMYPTDAASHNTQECSKILFFTEPLVPKLQQTRPSLITDCMQLTVLTVLAPASICLCGWWAYPASALALCLTA